VKSQFVSERPGQFNELPRQPRRVRLTSPRGDQPHLRPEIATAFFGYGYQTWIFPGERRMFALLGVRGQSIFVDPQSRLVMVHTAVRKQPAAGPGPRESTALWAAAVRELGGSR